MAAGFFSVRFRRGYGHVGGRLDTDYRISLDADEQRSSLSAFFGRFPLVVKRLSFRFWSRRQDRPVIPLLLVCLPGDTTLRPRLNRSFLLETASSARCLRFGCKFLQGFHRDTILQSGLVCCMEKDPVRMKTQFIALRTS